MPLIRRKKAADNDKDKPPSSDSKLTREASEDEDDGDNKTHSNSKKKSSAKRTSSAERRKWSCVDSCCWFIGCVCVTWWLLLFLYKAMPASFPQYVTEAITGPLPDPPGVKLKKEGLTAQHPVVFVPGIVTGGLELWEGRQCAEGLFRKRLWGGTFGEVYKRPLCWVEHMSLDNETGLDPCGIRVRPVPGLVAADYFAPGYFVWAVMIANLAQIGYEEKTMYMASYDWRLSFQNTEVRDQSLSRMKSNIELMVATNGGKKAVIIPHSMGVLYFLHFMKWVETPTPMGGGGGPDWCCKHIKAVVNIGGPFLGVPKAIAGLFSAEAKDIAVARAIAPGFLDNDIFRLQTLQHVMRMTRTWDSTMSMIPKGGDTIWGGLDWSPEGGYTPSKKKQKNNDSQTISQNETPVLASATKDVNYGRIISFGKDVAEARSSEFERIDFRNTIRTRSAANITCGDVWTEYHEMGVGGIQAIAEYKAYTAGELVDLLDFVAPRMLARGSAHFSYGIADNLDDPKYKHYKYWSNPLETKLPKAPDMEIYSMYGVGIQTERAYVYKLSSSPECYIPFQIDTSADDEDSGLNDGVYSVDGDETVPVLSAGFMCAKAWRGKTRFNPSGIRTYIREYDHSPPANLLEGRGTQSGAHVDIMGNFALIEDIMRVAAGATGEDLGGDQVYSDIFKWSDKIDLPLCSQLAHWRGHRAYLYYKSLLKAIIITQCGWRCRVARRELKALKMAARETGALKEAKDKLEKRVEELTWRLQLEKRLRADLEEAKAQEIAKFKDIVHVLQVQIDETNAMLVKEREAARKAIEEASPFIKETPVIVQDTEKINSLTLEVEKLKAVLLSEAQSADEAKKASAVYKANNEELTRRLEDAEKKVDKFRDLTERLEEKLSNLESENQVLRQQALSISPTAKSLSARQKSTIIQRTPENGNILNGESKKAPDSVLALPSSPEPKTEEKPQKSLNEKQQENQDLLMKCISQDLGFSGGKPIAAFLIYKCLIHWRSFEVERTSVFDRIIQTIGSAIEAPRAARAGLVKGRAQANTVAQQALIGHWQNIAKVLDNYLKTMRANYVRTRSVHSRA